LATTNNKKFEVAIHNAEVRKLLKEGDKHKILTDDWADTHYIEIEAVDEADARAKIETRYPKAKSFVITHVLKVG
jgi:hypothetical protein